MPTSYRQLHRKNIWIQRKRTVKLCESNSLRHLSTSLQDRFLIVLLLILHDQPQLRHIIQDGATRRPIMRPKHHPNRRRPPSTPYVLLHMSEQQARACIVASISFCLYKPHRRRRAGRHRRLFIMGSYLVGVVCTANELHAECVIVCPCVCEETLEALRRSDVGSSKRDIVSSRIYGARIRRADGDRPGMCCI
jgi:hypothetical protein